MLLSRRLLFKWLLPSTVINLGMSSESWSKNRNTVSPKHLTLNWKIMKIQG